MSVRTAQLVLRIAATTIGLAATVVALPGCDHTGGPVHIETQSYEIGGRVVGLRVSSSGGRIDLVTRAGNATRITETVSYDDDRPVTRHSVQGDQLVVQTSGCPDDSHQCSVSYQIEVPPGLAARLDSAGGDIGLHALTGDLDISSGGGQLRADTLAARKLVVRTGGGSADVRFTAVPDRVDLDTAGGQAVVRLPDGRYAVETDSAGGDNRAAVRLDPASPHRVSIRTGGGDVSVDVSAE
jgi:hypothetical protein